MPHARASECRGWTSIADLLTKEETGDARVALIGAPLNERSLTPGRCDLAPKTVRETLKRLSTYAADRDLDLADTLRVFDAGDLNLKVTTPADAFIPIREAAAALGNRYELVILLGGNNAVTRPGVHALDPTLSAVGLLTFDAHFDLRDVDCGLTNGNPLQALLEDGLPGGLISQLGLAAFANTKAMAHKANDAGISWRTIDAIGPGGFAAAAHEELNRLSERVERIYVDIDIDVIDRGFAPGAPGARPGGASAADVFAAAHAVGAHPAVRAVDLTEFDPSLDVSDATALVAARIVAEILAGFAAREAS